MIVECLEIVASFTDFGRREFAPNIVARSWHRVFEAAVRKAALDSIEAMSPAAARGLCAAIDLTLIETLRLETQLTLWCVRTDTGTTFSSVCWPREPVNDVEPSAAHVLMRFRLRDDSAFSAHGAWVPSGQGDIVNHRVDLATYPAAAAPTLSSSRTVFHRPHEDEAVPNETWLTAAGRTLDDDWGASRGDEDEDVSASSLQVDALVICAHRDDAGRLDFRSSPLCVKHGNFDPQFDQFMQANCSQEHFESMISPSDDATGARTVRWGLRTILQLECKEGDDDAEGDDNAEGGRDGQFSGLAVDIDYGERVQRERSDGSSYSAPGAYIEDSWCEINLELETPLPSLASDPPPITTVQGVTLDMVWQAGDLRGSTTSPMNALLNRLPLDNF